MKKNFIVDTHTHIGYWPTLKVTQANLVSSCKNFNISFTLVSFDGSEFINERGRLLSQIKASKKCLKFIDEHEHYGMLIWIRPHFEKNYEELDNFITKHRDKIYGLKFHPFLSRMRVNDQRLYPYFELAKKHNLPVLVHTASDQYSKIKYLERAAQKFINLTFIAAHLELETDNIAALNALKNNPNIYGDTAWVNMNSLIKAKEMKVLDKIMFGTDNPIDGYETLNNPIYQSYFNNEIGLNKKELENLMYKTAIKVYKLDKKLFNHSI